MKVTHVPEIPTKFKENKENSCEICAFDVDCRRVEKWTQGICADLYPICPEHDVAMVATHTYKDDTGALARFACPRSDCDRKHLAFLAF